MLHRRNILAVALTAGMIAGVGACSDMSTREQRVLSGAAIGAGAGAATGALSGGSAVGGGVIGGAVGAGAGYLYDKHKEDD